MALDGIILSKIKADLVERLPMRINRIIDISDNELVFNVHSNAKRTNLLISCHSLYNRICLSDRNYNTYDNPSRFVMLLRKYIGNGIIVEIEQIDLDRLLKLKIIAQDEIYVRKEYFLFVELMGKYANIILVDCESGKIIDALKRIPPYENTKRTIQTGAIYELPLPQNKTNPFEAHEYLLEESFVKQFAGFSKLLEQEVRYRLKTQSFTDIMQEVKISKKLYLTYLDEQIEYHVIPLKHLEKMNHEYDYDKAFDIIYFNLEEKERIKKSSNDIQKFINRQLKHYENKINKLNESYQEALNPESYKDLGDLLYTYGNINTKGLDKLELVDFNQEKVSIKLDPKKSIKENANRYYQLYHKKKKGQRFILEQLEIALSENEYFQSLSEQLEIANVEDAVTIKEELIKYGYLKNNKKQAYKRKNDKVKLYQTKFEDYTISFGKNHTQNNYLTFKYAKKDYYWFHAQGYHGCHLVIDSDNPSDEAIRFCANLAAYFSKGRHSSSVPVDYCVVKDVKKVKGSKIGFVTIHNQKTIYIDPEFDYNLKISLV